MIARVPASSANLGPGFDALAIAVSLYVEIGVLGVAAGDVASPPAGARAIDQHHPASVAFLAAGGMGDLWERSMVPAGRGLGFSGAVRVAGALLGRALRTGDTVVHDAARDEAFQLVRSLEGHGDNAAASLFGGVVVAADEHVVRVPLGVDPAVVVWIPSSVTKTDDSRRALGGNVAFDDAVFNVGRVALLVAALAAGDVAALSIGTQDRLHQPSRLARAAPSAAAIDAATAGGAWCAWLSGSGPTVAALCHRADAEALATRLPADGHVKVLRVDHGGATIEAPYT